MKDEGRKISALEPMMNAVLFPLAATLVGGSASPTPAPGNGPLPLSPLAPAAGPDIRNIVPPQPYYVDAGWFWLAVAGVALALAAFIVWWLLRRPKKPSGPVLTPRQVAARQLEELAARLDDPDARTFGGAVADVLRVYIGAQYGMHPERQTSEEFLAAITGSRAFSTVEHGLLTEFLDGCDLLKFARADATREGKRRLLKQASDFLEDSAEPEQPTAQTLTLGA